MANNANTEDGYYLRSKRRKLSNGEEGADLPLSLEVLKRKNPIMFAPIEVLQHVFRFLPYHDLSDKVRMVNRKFKIAAEDVLNQAFRHLPKKLKELTTTTYEAIQATQDDMEVKCLCRLLNMLEIILFQQSVIAATIWRYVYNEFYRTSGSCMYGGLILDIYETFMHKFLTNPYQIYAPAVVKDYEIPVEVRNIVQLTKTFCIHFDKVTEESMKHVLSVSSCKMVDLLDSAPYARRTVISERVTENSFQAQYCFYLQNAWFVSFNIPPNKKMTLQQRQRMMHMRMRRIILAHTEMFMQHHHYEREALLRVNSTIKKPNVLVYTGYGEVDDTFFCYGAMNDVAYLQKFHLQEEHQDDNEDDSDVEVEEVVNEEIEESRNDAMLMPYLGLDIYVAIECPITHAPYKYVMEHKSIVTNHFARPGETVNIDVTFNCPGAYYPRLPTVHRYKKVVSTR